MIAPLLKGNFEYEVSIICDEMKLPEKSTYKLTIE
jgi:hypothetical protein